MQSNDTIVFVDSGEVVLEDRPIPDLGPNEALVESERTLISTGTELTQLLGNVPDGSVWEELSDHPIDTPGYCSAGEVVAVGDSVDEELVGDQIATWNHHARYTVVDADVVESVPEGITTTEAAFTSIAQIVMNGVRRGKIDWGESVVVYGLGLLGQFAVRFSRLAGARLVYAFDLADKRIRHLPADPAVKGRNPADCDPEEQVRAANHGRLADVVFEVTGNPDAITGELTALREQGRLVVLSSPRGETSIDLHDHCNRHSFEIVGAHVNSHPSTGTPENPWTKARNAEFFYDLLLEDHLNVEELVSHSIPVADAPETYDWLLSDRTQAMGVVFEW